ncbi:MAG: redoxin domain-containing protein [Sedimentisphaerales bacterium]|nr:redoxin domain-containing protein [Sedimentisphaerales bacterium]
MSDFHTISKERYNINSFLISFISCFLLVLTSNRNIACAKDSDFDILKKFTSNINKIEDIQCTVNVIQTGCQNPVYFEKRIKTLQILEQSGLISKSEFDALIEPIKEEREENDKNKDFVYEHPVAKWKMTFKEHLYNAIIYDGNNPGILNYDGNRRISYDANWKRGRIDNQMQLTNITPDFILSVNNKIPVVKFFEIASENNTLKVTQENGLIEMEGVLPGEMDLSFALLPTYIKFTVDPNKMYLPIAIEGGIINDNDYLIRYIITNIILQKVAKDILYPVSWEIHNYLSLNVPDINVPPEKWKLESFQDNFKIKVSLSDVKINQKLSKDDFKYEFPEGTDVSYIGLGKAYIAGLAGDPALEPKPLLGKPLPKFECKSLSAEEMQNKPVLICFWDMEQRPSRNCVIELNQKADGLKEKNIIVIAIPVSKIEQKTLDDWFEESNIILPAGTVETDEIQTRFNWSVNALPWLVLADKQHIVRAEGFSINELSEKIKAVEIEK